MTLLLEDMNTLPVWTLSEVEEALLERMRKMLSESERSSSSEYEEERPCWWILSALDRLDGRDEREVYYSKL